MRSWSDEEIRILREFFPKEGNKVSRRLPGKNRVEINSMTKELGLKWNEFREYNSWTDEEEEILKTYYPLEGKEVSARLPRHSLASILSCAREHNLIFRSDYWTEGEDDIIRKHYATESSDIVRMLPGRTWEAIKKRAHFIGVKSGFCGPVMKWTEDEELILRSFYPVEGKNVAERLPGRTVPAIKKRAMMLGITHKSRKKPDKTA